MTAKKQRRHHHHNGGGGEKPINHAENGSLARIVQLVKLCGMFGSEFEGERATAAEFADRLVREAGWTWQDVLTPPAPRARGLDLIDYCLRQKERISDWEHNFLYGVRRYVVIGEGLTEKQIAILQNIAERLRSRPAA
jgi:hypothetical protein